MPADCPPMQLSEGFPSSHVLRLLWVVGHYFCIGNACQLNDFGRECQKKSARFSTYHCKGASIAPSRWAPAAGVVPQRTLLAGKVVRNGSNFLKELAGRVLTSCASCCARFSSFIGATAAADLSHGANAIPRQ